MNQRLHRPSHARGALLASVLSLTFVAGFVAQVAGAVTSTTSGTTITDTYTYTGATETLTVPAGVTSLTLTVLGAEGGRGGRDSSGTAPAGGYQGEVSGTVAVTPGQVLTIAVGQGGFNSPAWNQCTPGANYATGDPNDAVGGLNPLGGYGGGNGGSPGPSGCSGYGGSGGAASVVEIGSASSPSATALIVAGGSGGSGGSGQFSPTLGQISLPTFQARPDLTSTSGQDGESVYTACHQVSGEQCDGGGGAGGGGGAHGASAGLVEFGSGTSDEWFGLGGYPGENSTGSLAGLSSQYVYYPDDNANGSVVISYSTGAPAAPTSVYGTPGDSSASIYWSAPSSSGASPLSGYVVQYAASPYTTWSSASMCTGTATTCNVSGLTNGTSYEFEVAAVNSIGQGAFSAASSPMTPSGPPGAPTISSITPSDASLVVNFTSASSSLAISDYQYSLDSGTTWTSGGVTSSPLTIPGLTNGTSYTVEIRALNAAGNGAASSPQSATPSALPGAPTITAITPGGTGTTLNVAFVAGYSGGSPITGYDYATSVGTNTTNFGAWTPVGSTSSPFTISGLTSGTAYSVELRAENAVGPGPGSVYVTGVTLAVANTPTITTLTPGDATLSLAYTPYTSSTDGGSAISGVEYSLDHGTTWISAGTLADPFTIAGLTNGTSYDVTVRVTNGVGVSGDSTVASATPRTLPGAPSQVQVNPSSGSAQVSWTAPSFDGGSAVTGYRVTAYSDAAATTAVATCSTTATSCTVSGLANDTTYYFAVVAMNAAGTGPASSPLVTTTPVALPGAPTISTLTAGNSYLAVPFNPGTYDVNAPVTGYQYTLDGGTTWHAASGSTSPLVISGLTNGVAYSVQVRAVSSAGVSSASNSETGTPYAAPDPTDNATTTYVAGNGQVTVSWVAPNDNGAAIATYTVTAFTAAISGVQATSCTTAALSCTLTGLANGTTYYISIQSINIYSQYSLRSTPRIAVVPGAASTTSLSVTPTTSSYGSSVTLSASVSSGATGAVTFYAGGVAISGCSAVAVSSSNASCVTTSLPAGSYAVSASYSGNSTYASSVSANVNVTVSLNQQAALAVTSTSTTFAPSPANTLTLTTSGGSSGGAVTYVVSSSSNSAGCSVSGATLTYVTAGSCVVTATMAGGTNYQPVSSAATVVDVARAATSTQLVATPPSFTYGASTTLVATVTPGASGTVTFENGSNAISGCAAVAIAAGQATCVTSTLPAGTFILSALYSGDASYATSASSGVMLDVARATQAALTVTTTSTTFSPSPANTLTLAVVGGTTAGAVTYVVSSSSNSAGCSVSGATLTYVTAGSCNVTATMAGNTNYFAVSSSATLISVALAASTTSVSVAVNPATYAASESFVATVPLAATGTVTFFLNGVTMTSCAAVPVVAGVATCLAPTLPIGDYVVVASYGGSVDYLASTSASASFLVIPWGPAPQLPPTPPQHVNATTSGTSVTVSWTTPRSEGTAPITGYVVTASPGGARCVSSSATGCTITGLTPGVTYTFDVVATNEWGSSMVDEVSLAVAALAPAPPTSVSVVVVGTSALVSWSASSAATHYVVTASPGAATCTSTSTQCVIRGLSTSVTYHFSVVAYDEKGPSAARVTANVVLNAPSLMVEGSVAVVSWRAPSSTPFGPPRYRVTIEPGNLTCATIRATTCTIKGAPRAGHYRVSLWLLGVSSSPASSVVTTTSGRPLLNAYFALGSYALSSATRGAIARVARVVVSEHLTSLTLYGHADSVGSSSLNVVLSRERAAAVAASLLQALRALGYHALRVTVLAEGVSTVSANHALDRNVVIFA